MKFQVTEKAGEWIAGMKSPGAGEIIELTPAQAEYELIRGMIVPVAEPVEEAKPLVQLPPFERKGKRK